MISQVTRPLDQYRVLDLTDEKGYLCGKILADLGADVIKIEEPNGDRGRRIGPFYHDTPDGERSLYWFAYNTGKKSITLNLRTVDGRKILGRLVSKADFLVESFPPGYLDELHLDYASLRQRNPCIIMASITPFGQTGPYRDFKESDIVMMALGGISYMFGDEDRPPLRFSVEQACHMASLQAANGMLIANHYRQSAGKGQYVDVSIQDSVLWNSQLPVVFWDLAKTTIPRVGASMTRGKTVFRLVWPCRDGFVCWRILSALQAPKTQALVEWMASEGMAGELEDVHWEEMDMNDIPQEQLRTWEAIFAQFFLKHPKAELHDEAIKRGILLYPVNTVEDLVNNEQLKHRGFWVDIEHRELEALIRYPGSPFRLGDSLPDTKRAPFIGEHNDDIYLGEMGLSCDELAGLRQAGVV